MAQTPPQFFSSPRTDTMQSRYEQVLNENKKVDPENNFADDGNMNPIFKYSFE